MKKSKKINCKDCLLTCCDNVLIKLKNGESSSITDPSKLSIGSWFYLSGITLIKKKNGLWKCRALDAKTKLCKIWRYRSPICRYFFCHWAKVKTRKLPYNMPEDKFFLEIDEASWKKLYEKGKKRK